MSEGINVARTNILKKYGKGSIMTLADQPLKFQRLSTGIKELDDILGGGIPHGSVVELFGNESGGKTTIGMHILASCQKTYRPLVAYIDAEHSLNPEYAQTIGVDLTKVEFAQPDYGEQALEIVEDLIRSGEVGVIVIDSVSALTPKAEIESEFEDMQIGLQARLLSKAMRKLVSIASKTKTTLIFINQIREKCGRMWGNPETTSGGRALKFYSSIRLEVKYIGKEKHVEKGKEIVTGQKVIIQTKKNKTYPPFKKCELYLEFNKGIVPLAVKKEKKK